MVKGWTVEMSENQSPRQIALLGSTGSIGQSSLDVVRQHPEHFRVRYLTAHRNVEKLIQQAREFHPQGVVISDKALYRELKQELSGFCRVYAGMEGMLEILRDPGIDLVLNALVGAVGVRPTLQAIAAHKDVALANKETLVMAGQLVMSSARKENVRILPIDSEHSAIWQCLLGEEPHTVRRLILTASGGPFRTWPQEKLAEVTVEQALKHPNWNMGAKITIDSATLMNKGLEVIEAFWLYGVPLERIQVVVHPQSIIHSMVEFVDGSVKAQLGVPDMRIPIQYALTYPKRLPLEVDSLNFHEIQSLTFEEPDTKRFPCLQIAYEALKRGGTSPAAMNVANEVAVQQFLKQAIRFTDIPEIIRRTVENHPFTENYTLNDLLELEKWAREYAHRMARKRVSFNGKR